MGPVSSTVRPALLQAFLASLVAVAIVAASCGDGGGSENASSTATPVVEGAGGQLLGLLSRGLGVTYRVSYATSSPEGSGDTFVVYSAPPRARIETVPGGSTEASSLIISQDSDTAIGCSGGPGNWSCVAVEPLGDSLIKAAGPVAFVSADDLELFDVAGSGSRTLAGESAQCFSLTPRGGTPVEASEYCFSSDGIPLLTQTASETVEAMDLARQVSDQDFVPPAEPQD